jgi:hypothetical protein
MPEVDARFEITHRSEHACGIVHVIVDPIA